MRKKLMLLCITVVFLIILCIALIFLHRKNTRDGYETPFTTNDRANIISLGDFLYYCDVRQNKALCSYNLKAGETTLLSEEAGTLRQTVTSVY